MNELLFPLAALTVTFVLLIPALTLVSRHALARARRHTTHWADFGKTSTFAWLVLPTFAPLVWLASAALHQSEPWRIQDACLVDHLHASHCTDALILLGAILALLGGGALWRAWREHPRLELEPLDPQHPLSQRLRHLTQDQAALRTITARVVRHAPAPIFSIGWFRRRSILDACFVRDADDDILRAALLHEAAHIHSRDTLRDAAVRLALAINPLGHLLRPDFGRWRQAREAYCDSRAVAHGGQPLALAHGIVHAARFHCPDLERCGASLLCGNDQRTLKLRLALLFSKPPTTTPSRAHLLLALALAAAIIAPHLPFTGAWDHFHLSVERHAANLREP